MKEVMVIITARTNMGIEFINVCGSGIFGILLSFCFLKKVPSKTLGTLI